MLIKEKMKEEILSLREQGLSYSQIQEKLGCSKGLISYHLGAGQKNKTYNRNKNNPYRKLIRNLCRFKNRQVSSYDRTLYVYSLRSKLRSFKRRVHGIRGNMTFNNTGDTYSIKDVRDKFIASPYCYITGVPIDITSSDEYHLDHIIPVSRGGDNSLSNMGITTPRANQMKGDMTIEELISECEKILKNKGYTVTPPK